MTTAASRSSLEHAIGGDGIVSIRLRDGEVRLRAVDGDALRIRDINDQNLDELFSIGLAEGSASFQAIRASDILGRGRRAPDIDVELPRRATVVVETTSAEVAGDGLLGDQRYRVTSGDLTLRAVSGRLAIESVSGDVDIVATGESEVNVRTVSGDVELRAGAIRSLRAATTSGDIKVAGRLLGPGPFGVETVSGDGLLAPAGDLRIEMSTLSGDLRSDVEGRSEGGRGHRSLSIGNGGPHFTFRSLSGDLRIVRPTPVGPTGEPPSRTIGSDPEPAPAIAATGEAAAAAPATVSGAIAKAYDDARLGILRSLERGEIDVAEAGRRLESLDTGDIGVPTSAAAEAPDA